MKLRVAELIICIAFLALALFTDISDALFLPLSIAALAVSNISGLRLTLAGRNNNKIINSSKELQ